MIGYKYRKHKRLACHWVLSILCGPESAKVVSIDGQEAYSNVYVKTSIHKLGQLTHKFDKEVLLDACLLLIDNKHAKKEHFDQLDYYKHELKGTMEGEYAYKEGYYLVLNRKDNLERIEVQTRWLLPILSLVISALSLAVVIYKSFI